MIDLDRHLPDVAAGVPEAFGAWMAGAEPSLRGGLRGFAAAVDVEAVLQEALLRAWQVAPRLVPDGRPNALLRFAARAARNLALDEARRRGRWSAGGAGGPEGAASAEPGDAAAFEAWVERLGSVGPAPADPLLRRLILACLAALPERPRQALRERLRAGGAEADRDIAARLRQRPNTFLQNFTRARRLLAACLAEQGVDLEEERA